MWNKLERVDWDRYKIQGANAPDVLRLIKDIFNEDEMVSWNAADDLSRLLQYIYTKNLNNLPADIVHILLDLLLISRERQVILITMILSDLISYSIVINLDDISAKAHSLKVEICKGRERLIEIKDKTQDEILKSDLAYILEQCDRDH